MKPFLRVDRKELVEHFHDYRGHAYEEGKLLCDPSATQEYVLIVRSGTVRVSLLSTKGSERLLYYASSGCVFGDSMVFGNRDEICAGLGVFATGQCEVVKVPHRNFREALTNNPRLMMSALQIAHRKFTIAIEQLEYATFKDTVCQLADLLEALSNASDETGAHVVRMTHQDLADATGRTRVSVTNALSRLQEAGVVRLNRGQIEFVAKGA
ncbi:CRP-like cAMP-binding protein [Paraburkholderia sp. BL23I1N1]|uniref:Crp/Fnr family transcriptional regulator n=1 Tax=Paraburkholderia sp. BL23I1N1 TaxID=1938802 RepID=UPI000E717BBF|nr:Crp/Fnr family transcriptional regulator [Paraburkholderia sp. BL23I1N1]RKE38668.1 CRP-like cAMP-binding protein [Paraburkholderia sp. BL23I1N1]